MSYFVQAGLRLNFNLVQLDTIIPVKNKIKKIIPVRFFQLLRLRLRLQFGPYNVIFLYYTTEHSYIIYLLNTKVKTNMTPDLEVINSVAHFYKVK